VMPPRLWPVAATLRNYAWVFRQPVAQWAANTFVVTVGSVFLAVVTTTTGGYAFAFFRFPGKRFLWTLLLAGVMIPRMSMLIPMFVVFRKIGVSGTLWAAVLPAAYLPVGLYLSRAYFETVPRSVIESARIDGASDLQVLTQIVAPISRPIVTVVALFAGINALGDYLWQMLQLQRDGLQTMLVGLMRAASQASGFESRINPIGQAMAAAVVLALPMLAIFLIANRYFVGALGGAVRE
jgi:ABC-type glycerol-3-phosphate transport system permease component